MTKTRVTTTGAPGAIGPYSQAIDAGETVYCSGQIAIDPATGELVPGDITAQTERALRNLGAVLEAAGLDYGDVVKATVYLVDFADFATMNVVFREYFPTEPPTRATVGVTKLASDFTIEIEVIASR